jgi:hypothetical protein
MTKTQKTGTTVLVLIAVVLTYPLVSRERKGPFDEINFLQDHPGAGDRHVVFTPVLRGDHSKIVGQSVGADYGVLHYRDCNGDGITEAVVETEAGFWKGPEYRSSVRHVYKYETDPAGNSRAKLISSEYMPERDPEWVRGRAGTANVTRFCD